VFGCSSFKFSCFHITIIHFSLKVKQSHYRPGQAQRVLRKLRFPDFVTTAQDGGKVVSPTHRPPLPPGNTPGTHFCYRLKDDLQYF
jgi:hypothetical protein